MDRETVVELIENQTATSNEYGEISRSEKKKQIFAIKKSVRQSEFFQAAAAGFKPEIVLEVNSFEYANEMFCILENQRFKIYRAYPIPNTERTELYLTDVVGESNVTA